MRYFLLLFSLFFIFSCNKEVASKIETVTFRGVLKAKDNQNIPFVFEVINDTLIHIKNGEETIEVTNISYKEDSIRMQIPVFEGYIKSRIIDKKIENGSFINPSFNRIVPYTTINSAERFDTKINQL